MSRGNIGVTVPDSTIPSARRGASIPGGERGRSDDARESAPVPAMISCGESGTGDEASGPASVPGETACSIMEALNRVSGKWSIGILVAAIPGPVRFTELERTVRGISRRMLTLTLRNLERDGLLVRTVYPTVPPKVEYTATETARELHTSLLALMDWAERHRGTIAQARDAYDHAHAEAASR